MASNVTLLMEKFDMFLTKAQAQTTSTSATATASINKGTTETNATATVTVPTEVRTPSRASASATIRTDKGAQTPKQKNTHGSTRSSRKTKPPTDQEQSTVEPVKLDYEEAQETISVSSKTSQRTNSTAGSSKKQKANKTSNTIASIFKTMHGKNKEREKNATSQSRANKIAKSKAADAARMDDGEGEDKSPLESLGYTAKLRNRILAPPRSGSPERVPANKE